MVIARVRAEALYLGPFSIKRCETLQICYRLMMEYPNLAPPWWIVGLTALFRLNPRIGELIDEYGKVDRRVRQFKPTADRHEHLKTTVKAMAGRMHPAEESFVESGPHYDAASLAPNRRAEGPVDAACGQSARPD